MHRSFKVMLKALILIVTHTTSGTATGTLLNFLIKDRMCRNMFEILQPFLVLPSAVCIAASSSFIIFSVEIIHKKQHIMQLVLGSGDEKPSLYSLV